jgi:hypothetical protein
VVDGLLPEGVTLLAGKPKKGKSWMVLGMGIAIASGGYVLGEISVVGGDVLYLALEDNKRRLRSRINKLLGDRAAPKRLHISLEWPKLHEGGAEQLDAWLTAYPNARMVIIDTLTKVRKPATGRAVYQEDYTALEAVMNSIRNGLGMRKAGDRGGAGQPKNPYFNAVLIQIHNTL